MARIERDARELERRALATALRERDRVVDARNAHAVHAEVELDVDADRAIGRRARRRATSSIACERIERDGELDRFGSAARRAARRAPTGGYATRMSSHTLAHHLGLEWRGAGEPDGAAPQLLAGDARRFVRFDVRAKRESVRGCVVGRPVEITGEPVQIDDGNRRLELGDRQRHFVRDPQSSGDGK